MANSKHAAYIAAKLKLEACTSAPENLKSLLLDAAESIGLLIKRLKDAEGIIHGRNVASYELKTSAKVADVVVARIETGDGPSCPRCSRTTRRFEWSDFRAKALQTGKSVYLYWYRCPHRDCKTDMVSPPEALWTWGMPDPSEPPSSEAHEVEHGRNLRHFESI